MNTRARPHIQDMISGKDCIGVMFHDDDAVAKIAQFHQGIDQFMIVTLMQSYTWLIKDIKNSGEPGTDLGGQPDPLRFTA